MNLFKHLFSKKILLFVFLLTVTFIVVPFNSVKAGQANYTDLPCSQEPGPGNLPEHCSGYVSMDKSNYAPGEHMDVSLRQTSGGDYGNIVGPPSVVRFNGLEGDYGCNSNGCDRAWTSSSSYFDASGNDGCYTMHVTFEWSPGIFPSFLDIPYTVGLGCGGGGGGGGGNPNVTVSLTGSPNPIYFGQATMITWGSNADYCTLTEGGIEIYDGHEPSGVVWQTFSDISQEDTHIYDIACYKYFALGPKQNTFAKSDNFFGKLEQFISYLTPKASADYVHYFWGYAQTAVEFLPTPPPTIDLTFTKYTGIVGETISGTISHPTTTSCILTSSSPVGTPSCQTPNPFTFNAGPFPSVGDYVFTAVGTSTGGNDTDSKTIHVTAVPLPDLVASNITPTNAVVGVARTFKSTVTNQGNAATSGTFYNFFQTSTQANGEGTVIDLTPVTISTSLGAGGGSKEISISTILNTNIYMRACADKSNRDDLGGIPESDETNNCSADWVFVGVSSAPSPDLVASPMTPNPHPTSAVINVSKTFTSTITNQGTATTGTPFLNVLRVAAGSNGSGGVLSDGTKVASPSPMPTLIASASGTATASYTFTSVGTYSFQFCADKRVSGGVMIDGTINEETNEGNNCSYWTNVVVSDVLKPDLIASNPAPMGITPIVPLVPKTFSSIITNQGNIATNYQSVNTFTNLFQTATGISDPNNPVGLEDHPVAGMTTILVNGTKTTSHSFTFPSVGTYYMRACADKSSSASLGVINEGTNEGNNCSGSWTTVVVGSPALPDLTAGGVTPTTAAVGVSTSFSATISNIGNASTGIGFHNFAQVSTDGITMIDLPSRLMGALGAGTSNIMSISHTFTSVGIYHVRVCADKSNRDDLGGIPESNEINNCGSWTNINIVDGVVNGACSDPQLHYTCSVGFSANNIENKTDYTWDCTGLNGGKDASCSQIKGADVCPVGTFGTPPKCICDNGANNPPICTSVDVGCSNPLLAPYPTCDKCINEATNPPICTSVDVGCSNPLLAPYPTCDKCINGTNNPPTCKKIPKWWEI